MVIERLVLVGGLVLSLGAAACGGEQQSTTDQPAAGAPAAGTATTGSGDLTPDAGGKVILVEMETDAAGINKFEPASFEAKRGDVIRYTLISGVHNVHFLADSNPGKSGLPAAGPLLQLPMQKYDVKVTWEPGRYYFQCDPHALLGMTGYVTVTP
jgi:plastocyanin